MKYKALLKKIEEGVVKKEDFDSFIQESMPESIRNRIRRRMTPGDANAGQDNEGHSGEPSLAKRVQPKRKPRNKQMTGRGKLAHRHSTRTQQRNSKNE